MNKYINLTLALVACLLVEKTRSAQPLEWQFYNVRHSIVDQVSSPEAQDGESLAVVDTSQLNFQVSYTQDSEGRRYRFSRYGYDESQPWAFLYQTFDAKKYINKHLHVSTFVKSLEPDFQALESWYAEQYSLMIEAKLAEIDDDNDLVNDEIDNCSTIANADQLNTDGDTDGDVCDSDQDNDGVLNGGDSEPLNPLACEDSDFDQCDDCSVGTDGFGTAADNLPLFDGLDTNSDGICNVSDPDDDSDTVLDEDDNCPLISNPDQEDTNGNGVGDLCEIDEEELCMPIKTSNSLVLICL